MKIKTFLEISDIALDFAVNGFIWAEKPKIKNISPVTFGDYIGIIMLYEES